MNCIVFAKISISIDTKLFMTKKRNVLEKLPITKENVFLPLLTPN